MIYAAGGEAIQFEPKNDAFVSVQDLAIAGMHPVT
jgi:hypothetical protein